MEEAHSSVDIEVGSNTYLYKTTSVSRGTVTQPARVSILHCLLSQYCELVTITTEK